MFFPSSLSLLVCEYRPLIAPGCHGRSREHPLSAGSDVAAHLSLMKERQKEKRKKDTSDRWLVETKLRNYVLRCHITHFFHRKYFVVSVRLLFQAARFCDSVYVCVNECAMQ